MRIPLGFFILGDPQYFHTNPAVADACEYGDAPFSHFSIPSKVFWSSVGEFVIVHDTTILRFIEAKHHTVDVSPSPLPPPPDYHRPQ